MGLDMHFYKEVYVGAKYHHRNITGTIDIKEDGKPILVQFNRVSGITEDVGYLTKANAIHSWLVNNIQKEVDDCRRAYFDVEKRKELLELCNLAYNRDIQALSKPPTDGFFFGNQEQDEGYYQDIKEMIIILTSLNDNDDIYYESSW